MPIEDAKTIGARDYWTADRIRSFVDALDTLFRHSVCEGMTIAMIESLNTMEKPEQEEISYKMGKIAEAVELYRSIFSNHTRPTLFGAAADQSELANLVAALDPDRLSMNVLTQLASELDLYGLPCILADAIRDAVLASAKEEHGE